MKISIGKALLLASFIVAAPSHASIAHLTLTGTPGDYITGGHNVDNLYSSADPTLIWHFAQFNNTGTTAVPTTNYLSFIDLFSGADDKFATLDFSN